MTNILEGLQYREKNTEFPTWNKESYGEWQDADGSSTYVTDTQFRVKPVHHYTVSSGEKVLTTQSKTEAMNWTAQFIEDNEKLILSRYTLAASIYEFMSSKNIQFKLNSTNTWRNSSHFNSSGHNSMTTFRIRPDFYWEVTISTGTTSSVLTFDEIDDVDTYISRQLRTSDFDIKVTNKKYV